MKAVTFNINKWEQRDKKLRIQDRTFLFDEEDYMEDTTEFTFITRAEEQRITEKVIYVH